VFETLGRKQITLPSSLPFIKGSPATVTTNAKIGSVNTKVSATN
jgi:hypothetical protein